jgi:hypothetical protein
MESNKYLDDITEIKNMMRRSSRFISLSGLSGILAGIYALVAAVIAHRVLGSNFSSYTLAQETMRDDEDLPGKLAMIAITTLILAVVTGVFFSIRKAKKSGENIWDDSSKRLVLNFSIPLLTGGAFCLVLIQYGLLGLVAPATLIFYGLACVNASKYTLGDVRYLGIINIILGLVATQFIGYGLYFWALGFGVLHVVYGSLIYFKHDRA